MHLLRVFNITVVTYQCCTAPIIVQQPSQTNMRLTVPRTQNPEKMGNRGAESILGFLWSEFRLFNHDNWRFTRFLLSDRFQTKFQTRLLHILFPSFAFHSITVTCLVCHPGNCTVLHSLAGRAYFGVVHIP